MENGKIVWPQWMGQPPRHGVPWTREEEERLVEAWVGGHHIRQIAYDHGRGVGGIMIRLRQLYNEDESVMWCARPRQPGDDEVELTYLREEVARMRGILDRAFPQYRRRQR